MRRILKLLFVMFIILPWGGAFSQTIPNVLLIVADDHGKDAFGAYGNPVIKTPALDALAKDGMRFTNAFCTSASCSASRSVIMTGRFNHATGHYGHMHSYNHFSTFDNEKCITGYLEMGGYRTARVGKYHLAPEEVYHFQEIFEANQRNPVQMANVCEEFIKEESAPFFLYYCTGDPHRAHPLNDLPYKPNSFGNREDGFYPGVKEVHYTPEEVLVPDFLPDTKECRAELAQYYQSVSRVDQGVQRLVELLKKAGKYDNTIILYISDNGIAFPGAKTTLYDPGMELPCIVKLPNQKNSSTTNENLVSWVDLTPTILELTGLLPEKNNFHGLSFREVLENPESRGVPEIYASHTFHEITMYYPMRVVRDHKYKLIYNIAHPLDYPFASDLWASSTWQSVSKNGEDALYGKRTIEKYLHRPMLEFFDIDSDPHEIVNLAENPDYKKLLEKYVKKIKSFQSSTGDPWILKWEHE